MLVLLCLLHLHRAADTPEHGSEGGMSSWIASLLEGKMKYKDLKEAFDVTMFKNVLDMTIWEVISLFTPDASTDMMKGYTGLRMTSKFDDLPVFHDLDIERFAGRVKTCVESHMDMWYSISEAVGYDRDTFNWVYERLTKKDLLLETTFNDVCAKIGINVNPAADHGAMIFDSLMSNASDVRITIREVLSNLGASQDAVSDIDALIKTFANLENTIDIEIVLQGVSGLIRCISEAVSTGVKEELAVVASLFDALFSHVLNFVDYPFSQRLRNLVNAWEYAKEKKLIEDEAIIDNLDYAATIITDILNNGFDFNRLNQTIEMPIEAFECFVSISKALATGSIYDLMKSIAAQTGATGYEDLDTLLKAISTGDVSFDQLFSVFNMVGFNLTASIHGLVAMLIETPVLDLCSSFGFNLTDPFLNGQELVKNIIDAKTKKISEVVEVPEQIRNILREIAKIAGTSIAEVINTLLKVQFIDESFIITGDIVDSMMILPRLANDLIVVFKPIVQRLFFNYIDRLIAVLRKGSFTLIDLTSIIVPTWSDIISKSLVCLSVIADDKTVNDLLAVFPVNVLDTTETLKNFVALEMTFTVPQLIYVIAPNDGAMKLNADASAFQVFQGGSTVKALNLLNENTGSVTIKDLAETGLNVDTIKAVASDIGTQVSMPPFSVMDQSLGTHMEPAMRPLGKIIEKIANKEPVSIDEIDSTLKEVTESYQEEDPKGPNVGLIVGLTIMCLVIVGVAVGLTVYFLVIRKRKSSSSSSKKKEEA